MTWITDHSSLLNLAVNVGMFLIWVAYLQIFLMNYLRGRRPRIIISRGGGSSIDALCLVSNMSQEPIYLQSIYCTIRGKDGSTCSATITDREMLARAADGTDAPGVTSHGPLGRAEFMSLGPYRRLLDITVEQSDDGACALDELSEQIEGFEIMVVSAFGGDDLEIAAKRDFRIDRSEEPWNVIPVYPQTTQISSRRERKEIRNRVIEELRTD
ncbi:hypothetical protein [Pseudoroseicyclus tamaricis]|uniref:Uncharacterized protein n=1 Tax=Pseudoroseicyclus tamaricis TaxID=2705421 RepID=A0A6B2JH99_9RHOB|nr:hypothetical protein [Pseudoroseicyclus tamaricis]NDV00603.1 hypothetical protein [Pseudoroseicyclus tamaricis]